MRYDGGKWQGLGFLESVLRYGMTPTDGGRSIIVLGSDGELVVRDAAAFALLLVLLDGNAASRFRFVRAYGSEDSERRFDATRLYLFGRADMFKTSAFGTVARLLQRKTWGMYPIPPHGQPIDFIRYGELQFSRHQIDQGPWHRLFDRDYGLLIFHPIEIDGVSYGVWNACGFGTLGTGLLTKILCEPLLSEVLLGQADALVKSFHGMYPERGFEMATRIWLTEPSNLDRLLDFVAVPVTRDSLDKLPFRFQVELVAIAQADGAPKLWTTRAPSLEIERDGERGGHARLEGWETWLPKTRCDLVELLNGRLDGMSDSELCRELYPGSRRAIGNLRELVSQTNESLKKGDPVEPLRVSIARAPKGYRLCVRLHRV